MQAERPQTPTPPEGLRPAQLGIVLLGRVIVGRERYPRRSCPAGADWHHGALAGAERLSAQQRPLRTGGHTTAPRWQA